MPARLIPKGWQIESEAAGDLNRDGLPDLIFQLVRKDEEAQYHRQLDEAEKGVDEKPIPRRLVVAFQERGGYRHIVTDERVLSSIYQGRWAGVQTDLRVERGSLVIWTHKDIGNTKWATTYRFRWIDSEFHQAGWTTEGTYWGRTEDYVPREQFDVNLLTGIIERSSFRSPMEKDQQAKGYPKQHRYRLLPVVITRTLPASRSAALSPRVVRLNDRADVVLGSERWQGPTDLSADVSVALVGQGAKARLYVRALVRDRGKAGAGEVRLLNARRTPLRPEHTEQSALPGGYLWQARYNPAALQVRYGSLATELPLEPKIRGWGVPYLDGGMLQEFFKASLEVVSRNGSGGERLVLSTARSRKQPGLFWLTTPELPLLGLRNNLRFTYQPDDI